jgi:hypothetical protein
LNKERLNMNRCGLFAAIALVGTFAPAQAEPPEFKDILKKAEAKFEPAEARPGQTVTLKLTLQLLDGWNTYPTVQTDKRAKAQANKIEFPEASGVVFVDALVEPPHPKQKAEPIAGIEQLLYYPGGGTWERKAVVPPTAKPGAISAKIKFRVLVCDKDNCLPPRTVELEATLKVAGEPVAVDPKYKEQVEKASK